MMVPQNVSFDIVYKTIKLIRNKMKILLSCLEYSLLTRFYSSIPLCSDLYTLAVLRCMLNNVRSLIISNVVNSCPLIALLNYIFYYIIKHAHKTTHTCYYNLRNRVIIKNIIILNIIHNIYI
jgi:hypothetical protein